MTDWVRKVKKMLKNRKGFTLIEVVVTMVIAAIFLAITIALLLSTTNLSAHAEKDLSAKQVTTEVLNFIVEQTKYATEITPVESNAAVSAGAYTIPISDKIYNEKWPAPNPWTDPSVGISIPSDYEDDYSDEEKQDFYDNPNDDDDKMNAVQRKKIADESYKNNLIFYVGDESGAPAKKGYLFFKRADDSGAPVNVFGKTFYGNRLISLDMSITQDHTSSKIVVTETITLYKDEKKVRSTNNSFELVNMDMDIADDWTDDDDKTIIGSVDPPNYYICKDVKYYDW
jgi:prepilin-type N-terminal cleavage/methylation domain-containing protein